MSAPLFPLGQIVATPGALETSRYPEQLFELLARHVRGDWGCVDPEDAATNDEAVTAGLRILSAYAIDPALPCAGFGENCVWIITDADRSVTTILLPDDY
ncbi:MAG: type I restriction endonuclease subunit M [Micavibrio aeruginosavorus]|nr:type I restriction endonuclease subunit M [Micavibrio aeruginosavorus]